MDSAKQSWQQFVDTYWDRTPCILDDSSLVSSLFEFPDYFGAVLAAADAYRRGLLQDRGDLRILLAESTLLPASTTKYLPTADDGSIVAYDERMSRAFPSGYAFTLNSAHQFSPALWMAMRRHLAALYAATGALPGGMTDCHLILGRYREAPTRVHCDTASVFTLVLMGSKRIYLWPRELFATHAGGHGRHEQVNLAVDPQEHLSSAIVLEGKAGDVLYWPASYWHCAASDGDFHLTVHLANYLDGNPLRSARRVLDELLLAETPASWVETYPFDPRAPLRTVETAAASDALASLRAVVDSPRLEQHWRAKWLRRVSALNFEVVPPMDDPPPLRPEDAVTASPESPILCLPASPADDETLCAANGHVIRFPSHPAVLQMIERLSANCPYSVRELIDAAAAAEHPLDPEDVLLLLHQLRRMRAIATLTPRGS